MATIDFHDMIEEIIRGNGWSVEQADYQAPDNPPVARITEYTNLAGRVTWGVVFRGEANPGRYESSPCALKPKVIWTGPAPCPTCLTEHPPGHCPAGVAAS